MKRKIIIIAAVTIAMVAIWWAAVRNNDEHLTEVARCADAAILGQDWTQDDWKRAWDACWEGTRP